MAGDYFEFAERALEDFGRLQRNIAVRGTVEAVTADAVLLVKVVGQAVEVGVRRQRLVEGSVENGDLRHIRKELQGNADTGDVDRIMQRCEIRQFLDVGDHRRRDDHRAGEFVAAMDDAMADGTDLFRVESEGLAEQGRRFPDHLEQVGKLERGVVDRSLLGANLDANPGDLLVGVIDDAMHIGAAFFRVVDAEMNLAYTDVENDDLARFVGLQRQGVRVA